MKRPLSITVIGTIAILLGAAAVVDVMTKLFHQQVDLNFAVLLIFVGWGLLKMKESSRKWAIFWIILFYIIIAFLFVAVLAGKAEVTFCGTLLIGPQRILASMGLLLLCVPLVWAHCILAGQKMKEMFIICNNRNRGDRRDAAAAPNDQPTESTPKPPGDYCPFCGTRVSPDYVCCPVCGKNLPTGVEAK